MDASFAVLLKAHITAVTTPAAMGACGAAARGVAAAAAAAGTAVCVAAAAHAATAALTLSLTGTADTAAFLLLNCANPHLPLYAKIHLLLLLLDIGVRSLLFHQIPA